MPLVKILGRERDRFIREVPESDAYDITPNTYGSIMKNARDIIASPKSANEQRKMNYVKKEIPHHISGQFLGVIHRPKPVQNIPGITNAYFHGEPYSAYSDVIDLKTGSWARLNKNRDGYDVL